MSAQMEAGCCTTAIDVHAHAFLPSVQQLVAGLPGLEAAERIELERTGTDSAAVNAEMISARYPLLSDLDRRIDAMNDTGVTAQVISVTPTQYFSWAERGLARDIAQATNSEIAALCGRRPDLFTGFGVIPLQHPSDAAAALSHAINDCSLKGVEIASFAPGSEHTVELSDRRLDEFWHLAESTGAVVFLHPWGCSLDRRLDKWYLYNSVGQPVEHAVALSHLIFGGVLDRFPKLNIIAAHGGGYLPAHVGRADHAWKVRSEITCLEPPSSYLSKLHFDSLLHRPESLTALLGVVGRERILLGSDYPFDMGSDDPVRELGRSRLTEEERTAILSGNARRLGLMPSGGMSSEQMSVD